MSTKVPCFFCDLTFLSFDFVVAHVKLKHKSLMYEEVHCPVDGCQKIYNDTYSLIRHVKNTHKTFFPPTLLFQ